MSTPSTNGLGQAMGDFLARLDEPHGALLREAGAALCRAIEEGHTCLPFEPGWESLRASRVVATAGERAPLVLDNGRLYLRRLWRSECALAERLRVLAKRELPPADLALPDTWPAEQQQAAHMLSRRGLVILTGGPGTGKSTLAAALAEAAAGLSVRFAAPTGRAAARLAESLQARNLPVDPMTLHRLLGYRPQHGFRHGADNPIDCDLLVVDECSMVDLGLFAKLLEAIDPSRTRLLLLGDADQLSSVEAGSVFRECVLSAENDAASLLREHVVRLCKNFRFDAASETGLLSAHMQSGDTEQALALLKNGNDAVQLASPTRRDLKTQIVGRFADLLAAKDAEAALAAAAQFKVLCPLRQGLDGAEAWNDRIRGWLPKSPQALPVIHTGNDYERQLFNGDSGILWNADGAGELCFPAAGGLRRFPAARLYDWRESFAMTVHRAQGSEYREVCLLLPPEDHPLLTRELLYTAVTRARERVRIIGSEAVFAQAMQRHTQRYSGLQERLSQ